MEEEVVNVENMAQQDQAMRESENILKLEAEINEKKAELLDEWIKQQADNGNKKAAEIIELKAKINSFGKTEIVDGGEGSYDKPFVFDLAEDLIPNAYYSHNDLKWVYMGKAAKKTTWEDAEPFMGDVDW